MTHSSRISITTRIGLLLALFVFLTQLPAAHAQQDYVGRYDLYAGFSDLYTPAINKINQTGVHIQAGINNNRWLSTGFDYSVQSGNTSLIPSIATPALQQEIGLEEEELESLGLLPPGYSLNIPLSATTQTFTAGSQLNYRHFSKMTLFIRPSLAAFRLSATPHPNPQDPFAVGVAEMLVQHAPLVDWTGAYGVGGGVEFPLMKHIGVRAQLDAAWNHPFNDILGKGGWSYRYSVGPSFHFGRNITAHVRKVN
jgi:hypothetical protein